MSSKRVDPRAQPTQERSRETVNQLLDATEQISRRIGFEAATTKAIATVAGVSPASLYRYFPSKEALLAELVRRHWEIGVQEFGGAIALLKPGPFHEIVQEVAKLAFRMVASRLEILGTMKIETDNVVHLGAEPIENAIVLVAGALERRRSELAVDDLRVASILVVRSVVFLARVGVRDYPDLVKEGRYVDEVGVMVSRYLVGPTSAP